jgi:glycosyltransferase involved in cell wall biosynthesis
LAIGTFLPQVGGAETQALAHSCSLRARGYESTIVTLRHQRSWAKYQTIEGVPVIRVAGRIAGDRQRLPGLMRKLAYLLGIFILGWTLWRHRRHYDVLCVYQLNLLVLPAALACLLAQKPMVISLRSADSTNGPSSRRSPSEPRVDELRRGMQAGNREVSDVQMLGRLGSPVRRCILFLLQRSHVTVVALSSRMQRELVSAGIGLPVICVPNGVDVRRFAPASRKSLDCERCQTVVCVTRLAYSKGVDILLEAWRLVQEQEPVARLIIVGAGPLRDELTRLAEALNVTRSVEFAGLQSDVPTQLHRGGVAVLASRWEGLPNAMLEAMACGLPGVATRVSGSEDIVEDGVNGLLVEPEDPAALAHALIRLIQNPDLAQQYGRAARATVEQCYSLERNADTYIALYEQLAGLPRNVRVR